MSDQIFAMQSLKYNMFYACGAPWFDFYCAIQPIRHPQTFKLRKNYA